MACLNFLAPAVIGRLRRNDVIVVQDFSGQNAGQPTACFRGERPIFDANLIRRGRIIRRDTEFIPITRLGTVRTGLRITNIRFLGNCTFGEDFTPRYRGQIVPTKTCGCAKSGRVKKKRKVSTSPSNTGRRKK